MRHAQPSREGSVGSARARRRGACRVERMRRPTSTRQSSTTGSFSTPASVGAYVAFVRARERLERRLGYHMASLVAAGRLLFRMPTFRVTLRVEGVDRHYITPLVFIGVGERELRLPTLGARVPNGKSGLHVMVVRRRSGARALATGLAAAARGVKAVARTPAMDAFLVESCRIEPRTTRLSLDGELVSLAPPFEYRHVPARLRVVVAGTRRARIRLAADARIGHSFGEWPHPPIHPPPLLLRRPPRRSISRSPTASPPSSASGASCFGRASC